MESLMDYLGFFALIIVVLRLTSGLLRFIYLYTAKPLNVKKMGQWALITGATDGIGRAYAEALAKKGLDIILVSRTPFKLQSVAATIESQFGVRTKIIDIDFSVDEVQYTERLKKELKGLEVGVLVNNVGMSYEYPEEFLDIPDAENSIRNMLNCNIVSMNVLLRLVLPQMVERKRGAVVNLSSLSAMYTMPLLSVYAATKAYVSALSRGLQVEYAGKGIVVQCVLPSFVVSKMSKIRKPSLFVPTPDDFVKSALNRLGVQSHTTGYWSHEVHSWVFDLIPEYLRSKLFYGKLNAFRVKFLKKKK